MLKCYFYTYSLKKDDFVSTYRQTSPPVIRSFQTGKMNLPNWITQLPKKLLKKLPDQQNT